MKLNSFMNSSEYHRNSVFKNFKSATWHWQQWYANNHQVDTMIISGVPLLLSNDIIPNTPHRELWWTWSVEWLCIGFFSWTSSYTCSSFSAYSYSEIYTGKTFWKRGDAEIKFACWMQAWSIVSMFNGGGCWHQYFEFSINSNDNHCTSAVSSQYQVTAAKDIIPQYVMWLMHLLILLRCPI